MATYYVKNGGGGAGTIESPFATITQVNAQVLNPGDSVLFNRGDIWVVTQSNGSDALKIDDYSGEEGNPITYGAYGTGDRPIITGRQSFSGWDTSGNWTNVSGNIWSKTGLATYPYSQNNRGRLWLNGVEVQKVQSNSSYTPDSNYPWTHNAYTLYVYATENPATFYSNIEWTGPSGLNCYCSKNYITISYIDFRGGANGFQLENASNVVIDNCSIGIDCSQDGIFAFYSNYITIKNSNIESNDSIMDVYSFNNTEEGIGIYDGCNNWDIYNNYFANWSHNNFQIQLNNVSYPITNILFHNNIAYGGDIDYSRPFGYNIKFAGFGTCTGNKIYNNYFYLHRIHAQISGDGLLVYNNIIDTQTGASYSPYTDLGTGLAISEYYGICQNNKIYNNAFINCADKGIFLQYNGPTYEQKNNEIVNNIIASDGPCIDIRYSPGCDKGNIYKNNLLYRNGNPDTVYYEKMIDPLKTVDEFNAMNGITTGMYSGEVADVILNNVSGNPLFTDATNVDYLLRNYNLSSSSPAIGAGIGVGLSTDYAGNLWNATPSIGAYEYVGIVYYVAASGGSNSNAGTSGSPWATLAYAVTQVASGSTIYMQAGTHTINTTVTLPIGVNLRGVGDSSVITSTSFPSDGQYILSMVSSSLENGNQTISYLKFDGNSETVAGAITILKRHNVKMHHCTFINFKYSGVSWSGDGTGSVGTDPYSNPTSPTAYVTGSEFYNNTMTSCSTYTSFGYGSLSLGGHEGMLIHDNTITCNTRLSGNPGYCIKMQNPGFMRGMKIYNNNLSTANNTYLFAIEGFFWYGAEIYNNTIVGAIDCNFSSKDTYDYGTWIHDNTIGPVTYSAGYSAIILEFNTSDIIIEKNHTRNGQAILWTPRGGNTVQNYRISYNIFEKVPSGMYHVLGNTGADPTTNFHNINFYNNVFNGPALWGMSLFGNWDGFNFENNIISGTSYYWCGFRETVSTNINIQNNILYNNAQSNGVSFTSNPTNYVNSGNINTSPAFVDAANSDFTLQLGSPAINAGLDVGLTTDYLGYTVPFGIAPDIGAHEYGSSDLTLSLTEGTWLANRTTLNAMFDHLYSLLADL